MRKDIVGDGCAADVTDQQAAAVGNAADRMAAEEGVSADNPGYAAGGERSAVDEAEFQPVGVVVEDIILDDAAAACLKTEVGGIGEDIVGATRPEFSAVI